MDEKQRNNHELLKFVAFYSFTQKKNTLRFNKCYFIQKQFCSDIKNRIGDLAMAMDIDIIYRISLFHQSADSVDKK